MQKYNQALSIILFFFLTSSCSGQHDPALEYPDHDGHGYILTALGSFIYGPWEGRAQNRGANVSIYLGDSTISSTLKPYSYHESQLVFKLLRNGSLNYWYKRDYNPPPIDTSYNKEGQRLIDHYQPKPGQITKIYTAGNWKFEPKDSTVTIQLGTVNSDSMRFVGKYVTLGSMEMSLARTSYFDSTITGKTYRLKKVITTHFVHPWIEAFNK